MLIVKNDGIKVTIPTVLYADNGQIKIKCSACGASIYGRNPIDLWVKHHKCDRNHVKGDNMETTKTGTWEQPIEPSLYDAQVQQPVMQALYDLIIYARNTKDVAGSTLLKLQGLKIDEANELDLDEVSIRDMIAYMREELATTRDYINTLSEMLVK